jgi:cellulose biosynthesis protein BcsQ
MSLEWSEVLGRLLFVVESRFASALAHVHVVRDLRGRVRIAAKRAEQYPEAIVDALEGDIRSELGAWFAGPMLWTDSPSPDQRRLASRLVESARWPESWPAEWNDGTGDLRSITRGLWSGEERVRAKESWLTRKTEEPPWPLKARTPAIVSFYSFKGGVGRTTTLGAVARLMAKEGRKIVLIDLDLEAPGIGRFFDLEPERGILDLLIEHLATGDIDESDLDRHSRVVELDGCEVTIFPVGRVNWSYLQKLARLDFTPHLGREERSPVEIALRSVLECIRRRHSPDYIFIDSRAGLHDLGGLSLHALSHLDVLVGRRGRATLDGFSLALQAIRRRRKPEYHRILVLQTFVPLPLQSPESRLVREAWRDELWELVGDTLDQGEDVERPGVGDETARHFPWPVPAFDDLSKVDRIQDVDSSTLDAKPFSVICSRIHERCLRSSSGSNSTGDGGGDGREVPG